MRKYWTIFKIGVASMAAFRANGLIWMLFDVLLIAASPFVLLAIKRDGGMLGAFDQKAIVTYYVTVALFANFIWMHPETITTREIKEGLLTNFLVKPHSYIAVNLLREVAWKLMRVVLFLPLFFLILIFARPFLSIPPLANLPAILLSLPGAILIFYLTAFLFGLSAFWFEETSAALSVFWMASSLLGGFYIPIDLFPATLQHITEFLPWRYAVYGPVQMVLGHYDTAGFLRLLAGQLFWITALFVLYQVLWRFGIRRYSAIGR